MIAIHGGAGVLWQTPNQMLIYDIVGQAHLPSAVRLNATARYLGVLVGPAVGGAIMLSLGPSKGIILNTFFYLPMVLWLFWAPERQAGAAVRRLAVRGLADIAHDAGVPLFVDNTVATPYLLRPIEHGADVVIHSATKYLGGHGTSIAGVLVDAGTFDYAADPAKFPQFNEPSESYHGLAFARDLGVGSPLGANLAFILKARVELLRDLGAAVSPFNAFLIAQGLETLSLRVERHVENAKKVVEFLKSQPQVEKLFYASDPSSPYKELADRYLPAGSGAVLSFEIAGGVEAGKKFVDALELHSHVANIGDVRSLAIHPASTTHSQGSDEDRRGAGVTPGLVRLSVGIENSADIIADLEKGFAAAK